MNGHYHLVTVHPDGGRSRTTNEPDLDKAIELAKAEGFILLVEAGFVCTYGCGKLHLLTDDEWKQLKENFSNT